MQIWRANIADLRQGMISGALCYLTSRYTINEWYGMWERTGP